MAEFHGIAKQPVRRKINHLLPERRQNTVVSRLFALRITRRVRFVGNSSFLCGFGFSSFTHRPVNIGNQSSVSLKTGIARKLLVISAQPLTIRPMPKRTYYYGTRRDFLKSGSILAATALAAPYIGRAQGANDRINVACIGVGGKGESDSTHAFEAGGNIVAICDVDAGTLNKRDQSYRDRAGKESRTYDAKKYNDWRKMLSEMGKSIDAVTISTPDHHHGLAGITALKMGKHVYCQKPLTQTVFEAREMRRLAGEKKVATQMGNQGSAGSGLRRAVEVIQVGIIGHPKELHVWSNRPIWPRGLARPAGEDKVPDTLNWDAWLGPAEYRPYRTKVYHDFA